MYLVTTAQIVTVNSTGILLPSTPLVGRRYIMLQNLGVVTIYIGGTMVTANTASTGGFQLLPYGTWRESYTNNNSVYGRTESNNCQILVQEGK